MCNKGSFFAIAHYDKLFNKIRSLIAALDNATMVRTNMCRQGGTTVSENAKRAVTWLVFAGGLILGLIGWTSVAYSPITGTIVFLCFLFGSIALRILWGLKRRKGE